MENAFTLYTLKHCPYCVRAKSLLTELGYTFEERLIADDDGDARTELLSKTGMKTFPQIFKGQELIGGYTDLHEQVRLGRINKVS